MGLGDHGGKWFEDMFGQMPPDREQDACTVTFRWLSALSERYRNDPPGFTSGGSLSSIASTTSGDTAGDLQFSWLYRSLCRAANMNAVQLAAPLHLLQSWIFWRFPTLRSYGFDDFVFPLASRWGRYLPTSDKKGPRVIQHRRQLDKITFREFVCLPYRVDVVGAVVRPSILHLDHRALWTSIVPLIYFKSIEWHQFAQVFEVVQSDDPGPSADFLRWWYLAGKEVPSSGQRIPSVATGRDTGRGHIVTDHSTPPVVSGRRCSGQQATSEEDDERGGGGRGYGEGGRGHGEGGDGPPTEQSQGGPSISHAHDVGTSTQAEVPSTPQTRQIVATPTIGSPSQTFLDGLSSPRFLQMMDQILLSEPVSAPSQSFMELGSTPPSAHMPDPSWEMSFMEPTAIPTPPTSPASAEHRDEPPARGRGRRIPRRRGCDTGRHI
ncbi:hypothetical protein PIB30_039170 [Stylosanthes scabra]|uniref:Aminotransferase-like plant mobile domain-containing protein n=1 Tax=Stylosanthes scabra TaxID=79078 RepID=A0ABU6WGC5_9FABA|nr:hypothetical protein [Stylosanthes scabra]